MHTAFPKASKRRPLAAALLILTGAFTAAQAATPEDDQRALIERGRYVAEVSGCNDCHTAGFMVNEANVPEADWLAGDGMGWRGPWGTTYPVNLRLYMDALSEEQWLARARTVRTRPPMPYWALNRMSEQDLRALYHFVRSLGPRGEMTPVYVPPDQEPVTPYISLMPQMPAGGMAAH